MRKIIPNCLPEKGDPPGKGPLGTLQKVGSEERNHRLAGYPGSFLCTANNKEL